MRRIKIEGYIKVKDLNTGVEEDEWRFVAENYSDDDGEIGEDTIQKIKWMYDGIEKERLPGRRKVVIIDDYL